MKRFFSPLLLLLLATAASARVNVIRVDALLREATTNETEQLFANTQTAQLGGYYADDVFLVAGRQAILDGTYGADAWVLGDEIIFSGDGYDHVRLAGRSVKVDGTVSNSLMLAANSIQIGPGAVIQGGLYAAGVTMLLEGDIRGGAQVVAKTITVGGSVEGDLRIVAEDIVVLPTARITGDLRYTSAKELFLAPGVQLGGHLQRIQASAPATSTSGSMLWDALWIFGALLAGLPFLLFFPRYAGLAVRTIRSAAWRSVLTGAAGLFVVPMLTVLAALTLVGLPLALLLAAFYAVLLYLARIVVALAIGAALLRQRQQLGPGKAILCLLLGLLFLYMAQALPMVGGGVKLAVLMVGSGALVLSLFATQKPAAAPPEIPEQPGGDAVGP